MNECICVDCPNKCYEYENNGTSDKAYYEWTHKEDKCEAESEIHCNYTDAEIAKSFIEDVEAVKELLPLTEREEE